MICTPAIGKEVVRGTITRNRWTASVKLGYSDVVPLNRLSHLLLSIEWPPGSDEDLDVTLSLRSQTPNAGGEIHFDSSTGPTSRTFSGNQAQQLVALYGTRASGGQLPDVFVDVAIDGDVRSNIGLRVQADNAARTTDAAFTILIDELRVAAAPRPASPSVEQQIWDRYSRMFSDAKDIADVLASREQLGDVEVPLIAGGSAVRSLTERKQEIVDHLRSHRFTPSATSLAEDRARGRTDAFDRFQGHWRGDWRQLGSCGTPVSTCQDHLWQETVADSTQSDLYIQRVQLGDDSRAYAQGAAVCSGFTDIQRDISTPAINAINITTGVIIGAVGVRETPDSDGIRSQRPHVGFYVSHGRLLWVAEENRSGDEITYSIFYEIREGTDTQALYTIQGFELRWHRGRKEILAQTGRPDLTFKAGQYLQILTAQQQQLDQQFRNQQLQPQHIQQRYYRRQLERLSVETIQAFQTNAQEAAVRTYLERLLNFAQQQAALQAAPTSTRPAITFIMGGTGDVFYRTATAYFTVNPAGSLVGNHRTLSAVRDHLNNHSPSDTPWGEINIVVHANEEGGLSVPVTAGGENATPEVLEAAISGGQFTPLGDGVVDARTTIRIRGCALGRSQRMLSLLSQAFGQTTTADLQRPVVRSPIHLQAYRAVTRRRRTIGVEEYPVEFYFVSWPGNRGARPRRSELVRLFQERYGDALPWDRALRGRIRNIDQVLRDRPFTYTFRYTYHLSDPPPVDRSSSNTDLLNWLRAESNIDAAVQARGHAMTDYAWRVRAAINRVPREPDQREMVLTATGSQTILRLERDLQARFVVKFDLPVALQSDLSSRTLSAPLRQAFRQQNLPLSPHAHIEILTIGERWLIQDPYDPLINRPEHIRTFSIRRRGRRQQQRLEVSLETDPADGVTTQRAHPPVTDLRHFGEFVPARPPTQPLGENIPVP